MRRVIGGLLCACLLGGCATIFTGSSQTITVRTEPAQATVIVVGGPVAEVLIRAHRSEVLARKVVGLLTPFLSERARARLATLTLDVLITEMVVWLKLGQISPEMVAEVTAPVPDFVKNELLALFGLEAVGPAPLKVKLDKGNEYAVLAWQPGYMVHMTSVDAHFNWVTLVNVFNVFLGVPIDMLTGAWFNLGPSKLELRLAPTVGGAVQVSEH